MNGRGKPWPELGELPFGLASAPYAFSKITQSFVSFWRPTGLKVFMFLDDGACSVSPLPKCEEPSALTKQTLNRTGCIVSEYSRFKLHQQGPLQGFNLYLVEGPISMFEECCRSF